MTPSSPPLQSDDKKRKFVKSISVLSSRVSKCQESDYGINSEIASLHNLLSLGFDVISNQGPQRSPISLQHQVPNNVQLVGMSNLSTISSRGQRQYS